MIQVAQFVAVLATTLFAGAAIYINLVEHPARMSRPTAIAASVWAPSYERATFMQASLAIIGSIAGATAWLLEGEPVWLVGACFIAAVVPVTLIVIFPTNKRLLEPGRDLSTPETRVLLVKWGRLHGIRGALSLIASVIYIWQLVQ